MIEAMNALEGVGIETAIFGSSLHASVPKGQDAVPVVTKALKDASVSVDSIRRISPSLEDVFVTLIEVA
jgi:hypothetical protein